MEYLPMPGHPDNNKQFDDFIPPKKLYGKKDSYYPSSKYKNSEKLIKDLQPVRTNFNDLNGKFTHF